MVTAPKTVCNLYVLCWYYWGRNFKRKRIR